MKKTAVWVAIATVFTLVGCGDKNQANEAVFKKSIERFNQTKGVCLPLSLDVQLPDGQFARVHNVLGEPLIRIASRNQENKRINQVAQEQMDILIDEGFYQKEKAKKAQDKDKTASAAQDTVPVTEYTLTAKGEQQVKASPHGPLFCIGAQKVKKVNWFTTPTATDGVTISKVSYQVELKPERWAAKLIKAGGEPWQVLQQPRNDTTTLVQTNDGWRDLRELH